MRAALLAALFAMACGSSPGPPDGGPDGGDGGQPDAGDAGPTWSAVVTVDSASGAGLDLAATLDPAGRPAAAYFVRNAPGSYSLVLARELTDGNWTRETLPANVDGGTSLTGRFGASLAFEAAGNPVIAYLGGEAADVQRGNDGRWNSLENGASLPSDAVLIRKSGGTWTQQVAATLSDSIASTPYAVDNQGAVTGLWPALAIASDGGVHLAVRDIHFSADQSAYEKSNLEYRRADAFGVAQNLGELVVPSVDEPDGGGIKGAGSYVQMALIGGEPGVLFALSPTATDDAEQLWFARRSTSGWSRVRLSAVTGRPGHPPSLAYSASAGLAVAFHDASGGDLLVATSTDGASWITGSPESLGETGLHPAAAFAGSTLGVLYAYCRAPTDPGTTCNTATQELRFRAQPAGAFGDKERVAGLMPDSSALLGEANGRFVALWRDPAGALKAARRTP